MKKILNFIFVNWPAKIICLVLAILLWTFVGIGQTKNTNFPGGVPLEVKNVPQGMVAITDIEKVSIRIVADNNIFQKLDANSFSAYVDLTGFGEGTHDVKVTAVTHVNDVQIVEIDPSSIIVRIEPKVSKAVPVSCIIDGDAGEGLAPGQCEPDPLQVTVSGARSVINGLQEATARIHLDGETSDFKKVVKLVGLNASDNEIKNITFDPAEITVTVPVVKASTIKTVGIKVATTGSPADGYWVSKIETDPPTVAITAAEGIINQVSYVETDLVDVNNLSKNKTVEVALKPASGVSLIDKIDKVAVSLTVSKNQTTREIEAGFKWQNLATNLKVTSVDPSVVKVVVVGPEDKLAELTSGDISVVVDLSGLNDPGTHSVDIGRSDIAGPTGVSVSSIVPSAINVRLDTK